MARTHEVQEGAQGALYPTIYPSALGGEQSTQLLKQPAARRRRWCRGYRRRRCRRWYICLRDVASVTCVLVMVEVVAGTQSARPAMNAV